MTHYNYNPSLHYNLKNYITKYKNIIYQNMQSHLHPFNINIESD
jgi:hypothetical protein